MLSREIIPSTIKLMLIDTSSLDLTIEKMDDGLLLFGNIPELDSMPLLRLLQRLKMKSVLR